VSEGGNSRSLRQHERVIACRCTTVRRGPTFKGGVPSERVYGVILPVRCRVAGRADLPPLIRHA